MNVNLLRFLGEVQKARHLGLDLASSSGMEPLDLQLAVGIAIKRGFIKKPNGAFELTAAAHEWVREQLGPVLYIIMHMNIPPPTENKNVTSLGNEPMLRTVERVNSGNAYEPLGLSFTLRTAGLSIEYERIAYAFKELWMNMPIFGDEAVRAIKAKLHPLIWHTITMVIIQDAGMQDVENTLNLPARSAKALFRIGLDQIDGMPGMGKTYLGDQQKAAKFKRKAAHGS